jgi:threonine dehydrogenase-like Zn-dependent dehydrogenase
MRHTVDRGLALVRDGVVDVQGLVTHQFPLDQASEAFVCVERRSPGIVEVVIRL